MAQLNAYFRFGPMATASAVIQQVLRSPYAEDIPRVFTQDTKDNRAFSGPYINAILNFVSYQHLKLELDFQSNPKTTDILEQIQNGNYNISVLGGVYTDNITGVQYSYPTERNRNCIMVPLEDELPKYNYVVWPFGRWIWLIIFLSLFYIAYVMHLVDIKLRAKSSSFQQNMLQGLSIILYSPNLNVQLYNSATRTMLVYGLLFLLGFILSNYHICYMTTYNLKPVFLKPINSIEELVKARIPVLVTENVFEQLSHSGVYTDTDLKAILVVANRTEFQRKLKTLDRSFAYILAQDQWNYLNRQQLNLKKPYFHLSQICFNKTYHGFPMQADTRLNEIFNTFLFRIQQSGLWELWEDEAFRMAVRAGYANILLDTYPVESLNLSYFRYAWLVLAVGLLASCSAMFVEYFYRYQRLRVNSNGSSSDLRALQISF